MKEPVDHVLRPSTQMSNLFDNPESKGAVLSACGRYRYRLWRIWDDLAPVMVFVMLNPSTADASQDDPTIRKCLGFAKRSGHGGIIVVNLFAWRATDPNELAGLDDPVGPENDEHIKWAVRAPILATVVGAWGRPPTRRAAHRATYVRGLMLALRKSYALSRTKDGHPRHPLMLAYSTPLESL